MTRAPHIFANWMAKRDTPPLPCVNTVWPGFKPPLDDRAPGRHPGAGECGGFDVTEVLRVPTSAL